MTKSEITVKNIKKVEIILNYYMGGRKAITLSEKDGRIFSNFVYDLVNNIRIGEWNKAYRDEHILDGMGWEIRLTSSKKGIITFYGVNAFPNNWDDFMQLLETVEELLDLVIELKGKGEEIE